MIRVLPVLSWLCVVAWLGPVGAAEHRPPQAAIATAHPLATGAGEAILAQGGNAFDAAVAVSATLGVVEPYASGLGGGGFWLLYLADEKRYVFVDGRERAPGAAQPDMYLDERGTPRPRATLDGALAAGIPGQPAALVHLAARYGRLPLAVSLAPAIRHASEGFVTGPGVARGLRFRADAGQRSPGFSAVFLPGGTPLAEGRRLVQKDLAATLGRLAASGFDGFYRGRTAADLVAGVRAGGGIWQAGDLAGYRVVERVPVRSSYRGVTLVSAPPPSSGGLLLTNAFNILAGFDLAALDGATRSHLVIEALRRGYRDRALYLGDPDFSRVPAALLTSPLYAAGQRTGIRLDRATPSESLSGVWPGGGDGPQTTHYSLLDGEGNRVAATQSINTWFGAAFIPPGTGVILNNEMDDFAVQPGQPNGYQLLGAEANAIAPGKRMLSSMSPTFLEGERGVAIVGTPGGSRIISMVLLAALAWIDGADARGMVSLPRYHHQYYPDLVSHEPGAFDEASAAALRARGHRLEPSPRPWGNMQVVTWDYASDRVEAASDPRGDGEVVVY